MRRAVVIASAFELGTITFPPGGAAVSRGASRILYASDWTGPTHIVSIAWTRSGRATQGPRPPSEDGLLASGEVDALATAGNRIAYVACGRGYVWAPPASAGVHLPPPPNSGVALSDDCHPAAYLRQRVDAIAIGDRTALFGWCDCPTGRSSVQAVDLSTPTASVMIGSGTGTASESSGSGTLMGDGSLLVFSTWAHPCCAAGGVAEQRILRVDSPTCPCTEIGSRAGRLQPLDVDAGRMLVDRGDVVSVMTSRGDTTITIPVRALAAQLTGGDVVVSVQHELRIYDTPTGALTHAWPLPDVVSGRDCEGWFDPACWDDETFRPFGFCAGGENAACPPLRLEDASRGLAAYILDGQVHLMRLSDGTDAVVAYGTVARFSDAGLVYADGSRIHVVPFEKLPLH